MKYVIELPEYIKNKVDIEEDVDKVEELIKWYSATLTLAIIGATPLQAELEEIRADINQIDAHQFKRTKVLKILDNRIAELKGE